MEKVLLVSMPFGALERPALGLSLLKARLAEEGFACDVRYLNFNFAEFVGPDIYQWMCYELPYTAFAGDWAFTAALYGENADAEQAYVQEILRDTWRLSEEDIRRVLYVRSLVVPFLEHCLAAVEWQDYRVVGFTSTFEQNIASLAMAKRVKAAHPRLSVVFGGANWEDSMGLELHRQFPFIDYVCSGESEESFPALVRRVLAGKPAGRDPIPGVVRRDARGRSVFGGPRMVREMDVLPYPDYADFFHDLGAEFGLVVGRADAALRDLARLLVGRETALHLLRPQRRPDVLPQQSPRRALDELEHLVDRWQADRVEAVDNILDMKYFDDMLPALARSGRGLHLFYEVKANLSREQVRVLSEAGVQRIQPGIESLSDHVLRLMRKGTTGLRNVQLLKWAQEYGIVVEWNILYGFPGETADDYRHVLEMLPALRFLRPPCATGPIRLDRFSPYHNDPAAFGLKNVRPLNTYSHLYPLADAESLNRIAYYFEFDYEAGVDPAGCAAAVIAYAEEWKSNPERGTLRAVSGGDELVLFDTRSDASVRELKLAGAERAAYEFCDEVHTAAKVVAHLRRTFPDVTFDEGGIRDFLDSLVANRLMVTDGENYLSLALRAAAPTAHARRALPPPPPVPPRPVSSYLRPELKVLTA